MADMKLRDATLNHREMELAIKKISRHITELEYFDVSTVEGFGDPRVRSIEISLKNMLLEIYGSDTTQFRNYLEISHIEPTLLGIYDQPSTHEIQNRLKKRIIASLCILNSINNYFIEILSDDEQNSSIKPLKAYEALELHHEIERQVGDLYRDGHYAEAIEKSVKVLNNLVRLRSGEELDGVALMQKVFNKNHPILKFNDLSDASDLDEQMGFMNLFCGAVMGLRNPRAHKIIKDDPERALEFIAFISLLAKLLDDSST